MPTNAAAPLVSPQTINTWVDRAIESTSVYDLHTHLYPASFGKFNLWGIEELLTYHYLIAETMRARSDVPYETYWKMPQREQANLIWQTLFVERAPISEACRGVLTVLKRLGIDTSTKKLDDIRAYFKDQKAEGYVDKCFQLSNVHTVVMTNDGFDPAERDLWLSKGNDDKRYKGVLRIDPLLYQWPDVAGKLSGFGYKVGSDLGATSMAEIRRYLNEWIDRLGALYVAVSLTPDWRYPDNSPGTRVIDEAIVPVTRERNMPFAVMIGVRRQVNPQLKLAGDGVGTSDVYSLDRMLALNPKNKFMCTMLARENQHELTVTARKHRNLFLFGCWWFLNNPVLIEEMTRMRMELLGTSFTPQHSDARVLDQIIYKWDHSRAIIGKVCKDKFNDAAASGWHVTEDEVKRTVKGYLDTNFPDFLKATIA